jgi:hypothetical protein
MNVKDVVHILGAERKALFAGKHLKTDILGLFQETVEGSNKIKERIKPNNHLRAAFGKCMREVIIAYFPDILALFKTSGAPKTPGEIEGYRERKDHACLVLEKCFHDSRGCNIKG